MPQFRFQGFPPLPQAVKHLLIINTLIFFADSILKMRGINMVDFVGLHSIPTHEFKPWQPLSYMFLHFNFEHLFFNMYSLWIFGTVMENFWGTRRFIFYYFICGIGAGLLYLLVPGNNVAIGASGAIYGVLLAFAMTFPKGRVYIILWMYVLMAISMFFSGTYIGLLIDRFFLIIFCFFLFFGSTTGKGLVAIENRWLIAITIVIELVMGFFFIDNVAHFAHLGGMLIGLILILYWRKHPFGRI